MATEKRFTHNRKGKTFKENFILRFKSQNSQNNKRKGGGRKMPKPGMRDICLKTEVAELPELKQKKPKWE